MLPCTPFTFAGLVLTLVVRRPPSGIEAPGLPGLLWCLGTQLLDVSFHVTHWRAHQD